MRVVRIAVASAVALAALACASGGPPASADAGRLGMTVTAGEPGWVSVTVSGPQTGAVEVREPTARGSVAVARLSLRDGTASRARVVRWRCHGRLRRFVATLRGGDDAGQTAMAALTTPSCADRLRMIVVPGRLRPGESASVRITDSWRFGGIAGTLCARPDGRGAHCTRVRLATGTSTALTRVSLRAIGPRTIALRSDFGQRLAGQVEVRDDARRRVLVTGDSMVYGLFEALAADLGQRWSVVGDPNPGRGITTPGGFLDWPAHARRSARAGKPDVTIVFLGYADAGYPLATVTGETADCCEPEWVAAYATRVSAMMASYLRDGRGLVYWVLLPAPRSLTKARVTRAQNEAVRLAGREHVDGVRVIEQVADILSPEGRYHESIRLDGREEVVRETDGVHLTPLGIGVVTGVVHQALRGDELLRPGAAGG